MGSEFRDCLVNDVENKVIELNDELLLSKGSERSCYLYPGDNSKIIKIGPDEGKHRNQNKLDYHYYSYLVSAKKDLHYVTECFGFVETSLGRGLVFKRALNYDETASHSLKYMMFHKKIAADVQRELLNNLLSYLQDQQIVFGDICCGNIFCKELSSGKYEFIIVDGLGARRFNYKYWMYLKIGIYRRYKIMKQAKKMRNELERQLKKAEVTNPEDVVYYK